MRSMSSMISTGMARFAATVSCVSCVSLVLINCQPGEVDVTEEFVGKTIAFGEENAEEAGAVLVSLPLVLIYGEAFGEDSGVTGVVELEFPTPTTFGLAGDGVPENRLAGEVTFGSCTFTWPDGFSTTYPECGIDVLADGQCQLTLANRAVQRVYHSGTFACTVTQDSITGELSVNGASTGVVITGAVTDG